jgi:hypothetical protein
MVLPADGDAAAQLADGTGQLGFLPMHDKIKGLHDAS